MIMIVKNWLPLLADTRNQLILKQLVKKRMKIYLTVSLQNVLQSTK